MTRHLLVAALLAVAGVLASAGCDPSPSSALQGQSNASLTFYGKAVDENGSPLGGVEFSFEVEAIPPGWTFATRGKPHMYTPVKAVSGADGMFQFGMTGHVLRVKKEIRHGFRHLHDKSGNNSGYNLGYVITDWGRLVYQSDPDNPAVYVFVRHGATEATAMPCAGGSEWRGGQWIVNRPAWPKYPSLAGVVHKQPSTGLAP